jgi:hypothetical protein
MVHTPIKKAALTASDLPNSILKPDISQARRQLELLRFSPDETVYLRTFAAKHLNKFLTKEKQVGGRNSEGKLDRLPTSQDGQRAQYFVVNGQGQKDADVHYGRAVFAEHDDRPVEDQLQAVIDSGLPEPTCQVMTRKSVHSYWTCSENIPIEMWEELQLDLIHYLGSDGNNKNPSRVMRLAGYHHTEVDKKTGEWLEPVRCELISDAGHQYTYLQLRQAIPRRPQEEPEPILGNDRTPSPAQQLPKKTVDGSRQLSDILHQDILQRLSAEQIFNWSGHQFQWSGDKARGCCPWHDSSSGTAFHIEPNGQGGEWLWHCPSCDIGGNAVEYRYRLRGGQGTPKGRDFVAVVQELASDAGVILPKYEPNSRPHNPSYAESNAAGEGGSSEGEEEPNKWFAPQSWRGELGWWVTEEVFKMKPDPETGEMVQVYDKNNKPVKEKIRKFIPKTGFDFQIERELCSPNGDGDAGLVLQVKRSFDKHQRRVVIRSLERLRMVDFATALTRVYGHDVVCNLKAEHLNSLIHVRLQEYHQRGGRVYKLADRVGRQEDGYWIFPGAQFTPAGEPCTEEESGWVYNEMLTTGEDKVPEPAIAKPDKGTLKRLVDTMAKFFGPEAIDAAVFSMGWGAAALHYQEIMQRERRFPILNPVGDPGSFKTLVAECALSLAGNHNNLISRSSESALYERLKRSGNIPQCWDDPQRSKEVDELFKRLYNGEARCLRKVFQEPHSPVMATSNHMLGDDQPATRSRMVSVPFFPSTAGDRGAWDELKDAMDAASGALPDLIKLGYPAKEVRAQAQELRSLLPHAHARVADSLGLILWYAKAVARLAGYPEAKVETYVKGTLCHYANDAETNRSSLEDFLDKLQALQASSKIGGWNIRAVEDRDGRQFIAVHLPSVWEAVDRTFSPMYSRQIVVNAILKAGGDKRATQKFWRSEDEAKAYFRALLQPQGESYSPPSEPELVPRKCVTIPAAMAKDLYEAIIPPKIEPLELPELPPVTTSYQGGGNQQNSSTAKDTDTQNTSVTKNKKESVLEKETDTSSGDVKETFVSEKVVTEPPPPPSKPAAASDPPVTNEVVTEGNQVVTEPQSGNSPPPAPPPGVDPVTSSYQDEVTEPLLSDPVSDRAAALMSCHTWSEVMQLEPVLTPISEAAWCKLYHVYPEQFSRLQDLRLQHEASTTIPLDEIEWEDEPGGDGHG